MQEIFIKQMYMFIGGAFCTLNIKGHMEIFLPRMLSIYKHVLEVVAKRDTSYGLPCKK